MRCRHAYRDCEVSYFETKDFCRYMAAAIHISIMSCYSKYSISQKKLCSGRWEAKIQFINRYSNERQKNGSNINLFYSTPSCYLKSLHDANITWSSKSDDFFPYSSDPNAFWTGYFTSRPTIKRFERVGNHFLQASEPKMIAMRKTSVISSIMFVSLDLQTTHRPDTHHECPFRAASINTS